jgi:hypothetical protein
MQNISVTVNLKCVMINRQLQRKKIKTITENQNKKRITSTSVFYNIIFAYHNIKEFP